MDDLNTNTPTLEDKVNVITIDSHDLKSDNHYDNIIFSNPLSVAVHKIIPKNQKRNVIIINCDFNPKNISILCMYQNIITIITWNESFGKFYKSNLLTDTIDNKKLPMGEATTAYPTILDIKDNNVYLSFCNTNVCFNQDAYLRYIILG